MYFGFHNITIQYGKKTILKDVDIEIPKGKIVTIIGQNGCGKSSILKIVSKAVVPKKGEAVYNGKKLKHYAPKQLAQKIGYLAQVHTSPPDIDVRTLVSYGRYPYTKFGRGMTLNDAEVIDRVLEMTGLYPLQSQRVSTLSGGELQRAWIAMTICQEPEILILDEPTTYLDVSYQIEVLELVKKLNQDLGMTIVMVLHDLNMAVRYSDYLYAIKNGAVYASGTSSEMMTERKLQDIFNIQAAIYKDQINDCPYFIPQKSNMKIGE